MTCRRSWTRYRRYRVLFYACTAVACFALKPFHLLAQNFQRRKGSKLQRHAWGVRCWWLIHVSSSSYLSRVEFCHAGRIRMWRVKRPRAWDGVSSAWRHPWDHRPTVRVVLMAACFSAGKQFYPFRDIIARPPSCRPSSMKNAAQFSIVFVIIPSNSTVGLHWRFESN